MDPTAFHAVFKPYVDRVELKFSFFHVRMPDGGEADICAGDGARVRWHDD